MPAGRDPRARPRCSGVLTAPRRAPRPFVALPPAMHSAVVHSRLATSVRQVRRDQKELGPTELDTGRSRFLLSSECNRSGYYRVAGGAGLIRNEAELRCRTVVARLVQSLCFGGASPLQWVPHRQAPCAKRIELPSSVVVVRSLTLDRPTTVAGAPPTKVTIVSKPTLTRGTIWWVPFLVHTILGPSPPLLSSTVGRVAGANPDLPLERHDCAPGGRFRACADLPAASASSGKIGWGRVLLSRTLDAARSY